jgi:hypothetical protein
MKKHRKRSPPSEARKPIDIALLGLVTLLAARPFVPEDPGGQAGYGVAFVLLWLLLAAWWIAHRMRTQQSLGRLDAADWIMLGFVGWHTLAAAVATSSGSPRPAVTMLWEWIGMGLTFLLARRIITRSVAARGTTAVMIGLAVGLSLLALQQKFVVMPRDFEAFEHAKHDPVKLYELSGQWLPPGSPELSRFENRLRSQQPSATFALTNSLAGFLVPWSIIFVAAMLDYSTRLAVGWIRFVAGGLALLLIALALLLTGSRAAILSAAIGVTVVGAMHALKTYRGTMLLKSVGILSVLALCGAIFAVTSEAGRNSLDAAGRSLAFRAEYWRATLEMIADRPFLGVGPGQFQDAYTRYKLPTASEEIQDPHNWLLEIVATSGALAGMLLIGVLLVFVWRITRPNRIDAGALEPPSGGLQEPALGAACGLVIGQALAFANGFTPSLSQLPIVSIGFGAMWWILRPWVRAGTFDPSTVLVAVAALLLNLAAAGGIGYPSISESLWLLVAIGVGTPTSQPDLGGNVRRTLGFAALATCAGLFAAAYVTSYEPVTTSRGWLARADYQFQSGSAKQHAAAIEAAVAADGWSYTAQRRLVALRLAEYQQQPNRERLKKVQEATHQMLAIAPRKSGAWQYASEVAQAIYNQSGDSQQLATAIDHQRQAIERYPTSSQAHFQLATLLDQAHDSAVALSAAKEALRLDKQMEAAGHSDRRLSPAQQRELRDISGSGGTFDAEKPHAVQ